MAVNWGALQRYCADCIHYKTRVFRDPRELEEFFERRLRTVLKRTSRVARETLAGFDEVRIYWCARTRTGPYLNEERVVTCHKFESNEEAGND